MTVLVLHSISIPQCNLFGKSRYIDRGVYEYERMIKKNKNMLKRRESQIFYLFHFVFPYFIICISFSFIC